MPRKMRQGSHDGRLDNGMTRNDSPVYLLYPPKPNGQRPSEHTILQYSNPDERAAYRQQQQYFTQNGYEHNYDATTSGQVVDASGEDKGKGKQPTSSNNGQNTSANTSNTISQSSKKTNDGQSGAEPQQRLQRFWYCCQCGMSQTAMNAICINVPGCYHTPCIDCPNEWR